MWKVKRINIEGAIFYRVYRKIKKHDVDYIQSIPNGTFETKGPAEALANALNEEATNNAQTTNKKAPQKV